MASLNIPDSEFAKVKRIATMPDEEFDSLVKAFQAADPAISLRKFAASLNMPESKTEIRDILMTLSALFSVKDRESVSGEEVAESVAFTAKTERPNDFPENVAQVLEKRLLTLLNLDVPIGVTAKATDVLTEHQRTFCHARVLSDIRPIFTSDLKSPKGAVIVHTLQIGYREDGKHTEFYVALDTEDILKLKRILERAEAKTVALEGFIQKSQMKYLKV